MPCHLARQLRQHVAVACWAIKTGWPRIGVCLPSLTGSAGASRFSTIRSMIAQSANPALPGTCAPFLLAGTGNGNGTSPVGQRGSRDRASASYITGLQLFTGFETMFAARSEEHTSELQS